MRLFSFVALALLVPVICLAQEAPTANPSTVVSATDQSSTPGGPMPQPRHPRYQLRKGDSFEVELTYSPELNQQVAIQPDGFVTLKEIGPFYVEGQTVPQLTTTLTAAYAKVLRDPVITITLRDFERPYFLASGQVGKPGKYELRSALTVTQAIAIAGGFNDASKHSEVLIFHQMADGTYETKVLNVKKLINEKNLNEDVYLAAGDTIYVKQNNSSKVRKYLPNSSLGAYYNPAF